jgi:hypothetical protein
MRKPRMMRGRPFVEVPASSRWLCRANGDTDDCKGPRGHGMTNGLHDWRHAAVEFGGCEPSIFLMRVSEEAG